MISRKAQTEETNIVRQLITMYLPYWPLFLILLALSIAAARLYLNYATPVYEATARIMIKDEKKGAENAPTQEAFNALSGKKIIENETEVIRSRALIEQVVKKLHLYAPVYREQRLRDASAYASSPVTIQLKDIDNLTETKQAYFDFDPKKMTVRLDGKQLPLDKWVNTKYGTLKFTANRYQTAADDGKYFFALKDAKGIITGIEKGLEVNAASKQSSILKLTLRDEVPERGQDILNELLASYNNAMIADKNTLALNTLSFLDERLAHVEHELDSVEKRIQRYKAGRGAIDIGTEGRLFLENVSNNDQKLGEINMQLAVLDQVEDYVRAKDRDGSIVPATMGTTDPVLSQLVNKLYSAELEHESLRKTTAENNPVLVSITDQINKIKPSILENVQNQRRSLVASRSNVSATNRNYSSMLQAIPEKERMLIDINREQTIKNELYAFLLKKREETALAYASSTATDSRIIDHAAFSGKPVSPNKKLAYMSALIIALLTGIGFVYAKETFGGKIMFRQQIESLTNRPVIGEIPYEVSDGMVTTGENTKTFTAEQFRRLRITLLHIGINPVKKRILVTSSISGEGKSFVTSNLAMSLAITGKKVVLLDFDLNNPSLGPLGAGAHAGITEYLQGKAEPEDIIQKTDLHSNLYIINTGSLPDNPSELIMNGKVASLLDYLDTIFDYIVIDSAPVVPVTDAYLLSKYCDGTLYVVRHNYTPRLLIERIDENNKIHPLNNMAIIFNGVTSRGFGNSKYGYGYGYGYIYRDENSRKRLPATT